jgi:hypothetical protein
MKNEFGKPFGVNDNNLEEEERYLNKCIHNEEGILTYIKEQVCWKEMTVGLDNEKRTVRQELDRLGKIARDSEQPKEKRDEADKRVVNIVSGIIRFLSGYRKTIQRMKYRLAEIHGEFDDGTDGTEDATDLTVYEGLDFTHVYSEKLKTKEEAAAFFIPFFTRQKPMTTAKDWCTCMDNQKLILEVIADNYNDKTTRGLDNKERTVKEEIARLSLFRANKRNPKEERQRATKEITRLNGYIKRAQKRFTDQMEELSLYREEHWGERFAVTELK